MLPGPLAVSLSRGFLPGRDLFQSYAPREDSSNARETHDAGEPGELKTPMQSSPMSKGFGVSKSPTYKDMDYDPEVFDILDISPKDVAKQLTLLSSELFRNITSQELESLAWTGPEKERLTPAIVHITNHFNQIAIWVAQQILDAKAAKRRFQLICFFIRVAKHCLDFNNFDSVRSVVAGLQSTPVHRLERTWAMVGRRERAVFEKIAELASLDNNNDAYRRRLAHAKPPCVPYLGTHLGDLTFVYECLKKDRGNPARAHQYEEREAQFHQLIAEMERWRSTCVYSFARIRCVADAILRNVILPEDMRVTQDVHYQLSYEIEARAGASSGHGGGAAASDSGQLVTQSSTASTETAMLSASLSSASSGATGPVNRDDDSTPDKAAWLAMRKIDFALKTSVGSSGTFSPLASVGRRSKKEKGVTPIQMPAAGASVADESEPGSARRGLTSPTSTARATAADHDFSSSEMRSWSVPSQRSKRERPRIDALVSPSSAQPVGEASDVTAFPRSDTSTSAESAKDPPQSATDTRRPPLPQLWQSSSFVGGMMGISQASLLGNTLGRPVATRDRSASSAAETGAKDSYRRKMVEGIMKHIRKGRSKSHSRASSDALTGIYSDLDDDSDGAKGEDGRDRDRGVSKGIDSSEEYFDGHRAESTGRSNLELADAHSASMSSVRAIYHPSEDSSGNKNRRHLRGSSDGRFSYTARTNSAGSPDRCASDGDDGDGDDDDASVSSDGSSEAADMPHLAARGRTASEGVLLHGARSETTLSPTRSRLNQLPDASSGRSRREPGRPYNLLQGVLSKKEETDELGNRAARRDWVRVWAVLEGGTLTLYRYDKSMKGATFMASSTSRQLKLLQGSLSARSPGYPPLPSPLAAGGGSGSGGGHSTTKSLDCLATASRPPSASQPSADRDQSMMGKSLADGLDQGAASPAGAASGGSSVVRETPGRVGWSITDSLADLSFSGTRARARKTRPKDADSEPRGPSPRGQDSGRDLVERIVFNSMTRASQASDYVKRSNVFRLQPVNERSVLMKANSGHEMESWIDAIRATVGELRSTY
ncbi:hypothetical protein HK105_204790 [Polyrhizophydium stewartii]|uniref:Uncharacterized protein n=1 Tax=Polyrhizophydium stewartii TaxID=2732419 RepID=A0ABR4N7Y4_9FUNG